MARRTSSRTRFLLSSSSIQSASNRVSSTSEAPACRRNSRWMLSSTISHGGPRSHNRISNRRRSSGFVCFYSRSDGWAGQIPSRKNCSASKPYKWSAERTNHPISNRLGMVSKEKRIAPYSPRFSTETKPSEKTQTSQLL